jgi:hypothetical protein
MVAQRGNDEIYEDELYFQTMPYRIYQFIEVLFMEIML